VARRPAEGSADSAESREQIERCRQGERGALEEVFRAHAQRLERLLARLVGPGADVEDLLQDTFAAAITAFPRFRGDAAVGTWLYRIAVHVAHHHLRRPQRNRTVALEVLPGSNDLSHPDAGPDRRAAARQILDRLYHHLQRIEPKPRIAFLLHVVDDLPLAEVAALMNATRAATKSRVFVARRRLLGFVRKDPALREFLETAGEPR
jgi:RNA polymerase sigma-70 factor (ECF subfamily)